MAFDLTDAKLRLGIADNSQDVDIQLTLNTTIRIVEKFLDRLLEYKRETTAFHDIRGDKLFVARYPIDTVFSIDGKSLNQGQRVHHSNGWIKRVAGEYRQIDYSGGYKVFPDDLMFALWSVFDNIWSVYQDAKSGGGSAGGSDIDSITVTDVGTVRFSSSAKSAGGGSDDNWFPLLDPVVTSILELYKRWSC